MSHPVTLFVMIRDPSEKYVVKPLHFYLDIVKTLTIPVQILSPHRIKESGTSLNSSRQNMT